MKLYTLPDCLRGLCDEAVYKRWLQRKATAHVRRDRARYGEEHCTVARYKAAIHHAVSAGGNVDYYTGEPLDWTLVSKWDNAHAKSGQTKYKKKFGRLPTVDHTFDSKGEAKFVICSWRVNDMKSDLTIAEFCELCSMVITHLGEHPAGGSKR
jgi:hypothetical protein